ncbi:MAG: MarR family winged helix-turn-helix transcriptional regulator [Candidatus Limnocylindria bacterium]
MRTIEPTSADAAAADAVTDRIIANFRDTVVALRCIGSERLVRLGVSMTQILVLSMLQRHGDVPMSRLAELIDVSVSNATGLVDRMEERGYVERVRVASDRRVVIVRMTDAGARLLDDMESLREHTLREVLDRLTAEQRLGIEQATADLRDAIAGAVPSAADAR